MNEEPEKAVTDPGTPESSVNAFGQTISFRGLLAFILVLTLCVLTLMNPDPFSKIFENVVTAVVFFYFGQAVKK